MMSVRNGFVVVGCVFVGFVTSAGPGLVARAAEPQRWIERVSAPSDGEAQQRVAQLEQRLKELEAEGRRANASAPRAPAAVDVDAVLARNQELTARNRTLAAQNLALSQSRLYEPPVKAAACESPPREADPRAQLRYWAERLRDGDSAFRGRLTTEQNAALNVLLRGERELDPRNPWREP